MINLVETLNVDTTDFLRSQFFADLKIPSVVINDDGFLPTEVDSPFKYYCNFGDENTPLYFNRLKVPEFHRIIATAEKGEVYDIDKKRADIIFISNDNSRFVKEVRWLDDDGELSWIDQYNRQGKLFAKTYVNNGQQVLRKYFNKDGKVIIIHYLISGDLFLYDQGEQHFENINKFVTYYLKKKNYNLDHIFYNTLNHSMVISLGLDGDGKDTLFWMEKTGDDLPGNMKFLMDNPTRTKHVVFQNYRDWQTWKNKLPKDTNVDFKYLGYIYMHPRGNKMRPEALILTNSDQIEHLDEVVRSMPNIHFNIAAITEMSSKLLSFKKYNNIRLYPNITLARARELYKNCDIYLDINHGNEILDAVRAAFEQNMLIVGFKNTVHNPTFIHPDSIFETDEVTKMANTINGALSDTETMRKLIDAQRLFAGDETVEEYQKIFGELINE